MSLSNFIVLHCFFVFAGTHCLEGFLAAKNSMKQPLDKESERIFWFLSMVLPELLFVAVLYNVLTKFFRIAAYEITTYEDQKIKEYVAKKISLYMDAHDKLVAISRSRKHSNTSVDET